MFSPQALQHRHQRRRIVSENDGGKDIQKQIDSWTDKEEANTVKLEQYEAMLRKKYGNLDSLMAKYNTSSTYISQIMSSIG